MVVELKAIIISNEIIFPDVASAVRQTMEEGLGVTDDVLDIVAEMVEDVVGVMDDDNDGLVLTLLLIALETLGLEFNVGVTVSDALTDDVGDEEAVSVVLLVVVEVDGVADTDGVELNELALP